MRRPKLLSAQKKRIVTICNGKALSNSVTLIENPSFHAHFTMIVIK
jgi:hypothetical protein